MVGAANWQKGSVEALGGNLTYHRTGGPGPVLVLSHGLTDNGLCWRRFAQAMAGEADIVMLDARGHGESMRVIEGNPFDPGEDIASVIDHLVLKNPIVMGHSIGALATAEFAAARPGRAALVILEDPPLMPVATPPERVDRHERFRQHVASLQAMSDDELWELGRTQSPDWQDDEFSEWVQSKRQVDPSALPNYATVWEETLAQIDVPILLLCGETKRGALVSPELAEQAARINPRLHVSRVADTGHNIRRENFEGYLSAIRQFLQKHQNFNNAKGGL
jgi:N-formylmaleamate deformylase